MRCVGVLVYILLANFGLAQHVDSEREAFRRGRDLILSIAPYLDSVELTVRREEYALSGYDVWWIEGRSGECSMTVRASDGAITSFADYLSEADLNPQGERTVTDEAAARALAEQFVHALSPSFAKFNIIGYISQGPDGRSDPFAPVVELRLAEPAPGYEGSVNEGTVKLDAVRGRLLFAAIADIYRFVPPQATLPLDEAIAHLRTAWNAEAPHFERYGWTSRWPGDDVCRNSARMIVYPPAGAHANTSELGADLERSRTARVCWTFGYRGFSIAIDAEDGRLVRSDLAKQNPNKSADPRLGKGQLTAIEREHLRLAPERDKSNSVRFLAAIAICVSAVVGFLYWKRRASVSALD